VCVDRVSAEYIHGAVAIASNSTLRQHLRADILRSNSRLYNNQSVIAEWEEMLKYIVSVPRPTPFAGLLTGDEPTAGLKYDMDDKSVSDAALIKSRSFVMREGSFAEELDLALSLPYEGMEPVTLRAIQETNRVGDSRESDHSVSAAGCSSDALKTCSDYLLLGNTINMSLAILLVRPEQSISIIESFASFVSSLELSLGHSIPGGQITQVPPHSIYVVM
jgi:hypothetical protein